MALRNGSFFASTDRIRHSLMHAVMVSMLHEGLIALYDRKWPADKKIMEEFKEQFKRARIIKGAESFGNDILTMWSGGLAEDGRIIPGQRSGLAYAFISAVLYVVYDDPTGQRPWRSVH